jgi:hypothetical protein
MTDMIFDVCQRLGGYIWCSVVWDLIVERWQTIFSDPSTLRYHNHFGTLCIKQVSPEISITYRIILGIRSRNILGNLILLHAEIKLLFN